MIKTQLQIPDDLYAQLKELSRRKEWSMAETLRRGAELLLQVYPAGPNGTPTKPWVPPTSSTIGWKEKSHDEIKALLAEDESRPL